MLRTCLVSAALSTRLRLHRLWLALGCSFVAATVYFSLTAHPPALAAKVWDKANHLVSYAWLALWFAQLYQARTQRWLIGGTLIALGVALELLQGLGGVRHAEALDALANTLGVAAGLALAATRLRHTLHWLERCFLRAY